MITVTMDGVDAETKAEFVKYMEMFKSWGKQGDEGFYMELNAAEAEEVYKSSTQMIETPTHIVIQAQALMGDPLYTQQMEEEGRSPSPPRIGFAGPVIKYVIYVGLL